MEGYDVTRQDLELLDLETNIKLLLYGKRVSGFLWDD